MMRGAGMRRSAIRQSAGPKPAIPLSFGRGTRQGAFAPIIR